MNRKVLYSVLAIALLALLYSCGNRNGNGKSTAEDLSGVAGELCRYIPDHGIVSGSGSHMTADFLDALSEAFDAPDGSYGVERDNEWLYTLVTGNGGSIPYYEVVSVEENEGGATAKVSVRDLWEEGGEPEGEPRLHTMQMVREDGKWLISDFDGIKERCREYVADLRRKYESGEILRELQADDFTRDYIEEFQREVEEFYSKYGK